MRASTLTAAIAAVTTTSAVGGLATRPAVQSQWYARLHKPSYQPPRTAFPIVWPVLYADIAVVSAYTVDRLRDSGRQRPYLAALVVNLLLNAGWPWLFFNRRRLAAAAVLNAALTASSVDLARRAVAVSGRRAGWLALYPAWTSFACLLSAHIWLLNRRRRV